MLLLHEILAEGDEEEDADEAAEEAGEEDLEEADGDVGIGEFGVEDVECGKGEDGSCDNHAGACSDGLYHDVLSKRVLALGGARQSNGDDGDGDGGFEHLAYLQTEVCRGGAEDDGHEQTPYERPCCHLAGICLCRHQRFVLFARFEGAECVFGDGIL